MNIDHVYQYSNALLTDGDVHEVRCFQNGKPKLSGYFDNARSMTEEIDRACANMDTCVTLNPLRDKSRCTNRLVPVRGGLTKDRDIAYRKHILLDLDPVRSEGFGGHCATQEEVQAAKILGLQVHDYISDTYGFDALIEGTSGNGGAAVYRLANDETKAHVASFLQNLAREHDSPRAIVDTTVTNLSRVTRVMGTRNHKLVGDGRPNRLAELKCVRVGTKRLVLPALQEEDAGIVAVDRQSEQILEGSRNSTLYSMACRLLANGGTEAELAHHLAHVNATRCRPPLGEAEISTVISSALKGRSRSVVIAQPISSVLPEKIESIWTNYIPRGSITVVDGDPGTGKSLLTVDIAARLSRGDAMPDGSETMPGRILFMNLEDSDAHVLRPRLEAANADLENVLSGTNVEVAGRKKPIEFPNDMPAVAELIRAEEIGLLVIDPITAYLGAGVDSYKDQSIRRALAPIAELAQERGIAVLAVRHLNKTSGTKAMYRGQGSIGIVGASRAAYLVGESRTVPGRRVLAATKNNYGPKPPSMSFSIEGSGMKQRVVWHGECSTTAEELVCTPPGPRPDKLQAARNFLAELLDEHNGEVFVDEVWARASEARISSGTLKRARALAGVESARVNGRYVWRDAGRNN